MVSEKLFTGKADLTRMRFTWEKKLNGLVNISLKLLFKKMFSLIVRTHRLFSFLPPGSERSILPELWENYSVLSVFMGVWWQQRLWRLFRREKLPRLVLYFHSTMLLASPKLPEILHYVFFFFCFADKRKLKCPVNFFACPSGRCIPMSWTCDKENDCENGADETHCGQSATKLSSNTLIFAENTKHTRKPRLFFFRLSSAHGKTRLMVRVK